MMLVSRSPAPLCRRLLSQHQQPSSLRRRLTSLTIPFNPATSTKSQISSLITTALLASPPASHHNALVLLTSSTLAPWLQDASFLASLLAPLRPSPPSSFSLLAAAVDAIPHLSPSGTYTTTEGLSLLCCPHTSLWTTPSKQQESGSARLEFHLPPLPSSRPLHVTLPAALTVFSNGRPHTVLASVWDTTSSNPRLIDVAATSHAVISLPADLTSSRITLPLVPATPARKIVSGLGNILRQVDVDGTPTPASTELEAAIPRLLASGRRVAGVWAVVYPAGTEVSGDLEAVLAKGGHVRKVLSGGGGWGAKQGLLSLDPETRYAAEAGEGDVESFMRSFHGEETGGGVVAPGGWVQFMVEEEVVVGGREGIRPAVMLGTHVGDGEEVGEGMGVEVLEGVFGGAASKGIYVATEAAGQVEDGEIVTKIDAARAYIGAILESKD